MKKIKLKNLAAGINENQAVIECDRIFSMYWQNIVLISALIIVILFVGKFIIENKILDGDSIFASTISTGDADAASNDDLSDENAEGETVTKRAYLTFDDGPSENTDAILDILAENNVKATFFVIGKGEEYYDTYRRIVDEGHTLGLHSYSHVYSEIYASEEDFINDIENLRNLLYDVTGVNSKYYRFPGGSTNTVTSVPIESLIEYLDEAGITYFDWNALSGDAVTEGLSPEQLVQNILKDALKYDDTVILMHDLDSCDETVESLQLLIDRLTEEGYEILPIDENAPLIRFK